MATRALTPTGSLVLAADPPGPNSVGDFYYSSAVGGLRVCTVAGSPGTFVTAGAAAAAPPSFASMFKMEVGD